jgi:hypothetical protein
MKFDKFFKKLLMEAEAYTPWPDEYATSKKNPERAFQKLAECYDFLKNYPHANYDYNNHTENNKIAAAAMHIALMVRETNFNEYTVKDNGTDRRISKTNLLKSVLTLCQHFGKTEFSDVAPTREEIERKEQLKRALGFTGKSKILKDPTKRPYPVPPAEEGRPALTDMNGRIIPPGTTNANGQKVGTWLSGTDYRLSMYNDAEEVRKHGGISAFHHVYREIFPMLGIRYQEHGRAGRLARIEGQGVGEAATDIQSIPVYWWGENYLPYRTVLKVRDGKVVRVERYNRNYNKVAGINWRTDQFSKVQKPRPLVTVGAHEGAYGGDMHYGKTIEEVRRAIQFANFDPIRKEVEEISELWKKRKKDKQAAHKLRDYIRNQINYDAKTPEEKRAIYLERITEFNEKRKYALDAKPFFVIFETNPDGTIKKWKAASAEQKFKHLYPINEVPDLYQDRKKLGEVE